MAGVNKVLIIGNLGRDPEIRDAGGTAVCNLSVATSETWTDRNGKKQEKTEWHRVNVWGKQAEACGQYLRKGRQVYVEGRLQTRSWEDSDGNKRYSTEIRADRVQFLGGRDSSEETRPRDGYDYSAEYDQRAPRGGGDDDMPF